MFLIKISLLVASLLLVLYEVDHCFQGHHNHKDAIDNSDCFQFGVVSLIEEELNADLPAIFECKCSEINVIFH